MAFKKGESGNPGGRPKGEGEIRALARTYSKQAIETLAECMNSKNERAAIAACIAILDRGWGKPAQEVAMTEKEHRQIIVRVVDYAGASHPPDEGGDSGPKSVHNRSVTYAGDGNGLESRGIPAAGGPR
jgi:hypothetical protein